MEKIFFTPQNEEFLLQTINRVKPGFESEYPKLKEFMKEAFFRTDIIYSDVLNPQQKIEQLNDYVIKKLLESIKIIEDHRDRVHQCYYTLETIKDIYKNSKGKTNFFNKLAEHFTVEDLKHFIVEIDEGLIEKNDFYITIKNYLQDLEPNIIPIENKKFRTSFIHIDSKYRDIINYPSAGCFRFNIGLRTYKSQIAGLPQIRHIESISLRSITFDPSITIQYFNIVINEFTGNNYQSEPNTGPIFGTISNLLFNNNLYNLESCVRLFDNLIDLSTFTIKLLDYNPLDLINILDVNADIITLACETNDIAVDDYIYIVTKDTISMKYQVVEIISSTEIRIDVSTEFVINSYVMLTKYQWTSLWKFVHY